MYADKYTYYNKGFQYFILEYTDTRVSVGGGAPPA